MKKLLLHSLPWDQTTPLGYIGKFIYSEVVTQAYLLGNSAFLLLFIFICWNYRGFFEVIRNFVDRLNHPDVNQINQKLLKQLVEFHVSIKE